MGSHIPSTANGSFQVTLEVLSLIDRQAEMTEMQAKHKALHFSFIMVKTKWMHVCLTCP